jgi:hypothetical protein
MPAETVDAVIGIDTHRDSHEVEIADWTGKPIATMQVSNDSAAFAQLLAVIAEVVPGPRVADGRPHLDPGIGSGRRHEHISRGTANRPTPGI